MKRVTIKDLAKALQLNVSTISRALSDHPNVSVATKARVVALAKELRYKPNMLAKNFRNSETKLIALIVPELNTFFTPALIRAAYAALDEQGYNLLLLNSKDSLDSEIANIQKCEAYSVDGILLSVTSHTMNLEHVLDATDTDLPIVQFDRVIAHERIPAVTIDDQSAARQGTQLLIDKGLKNIYGLFGPETLSIYKERFLGYKSAMENAGCSIKGKYKFLSVKEASKILKDQIIPTAEFPFGIFCNSDDILVEVYKALNELNILIPDQVTLSGISDGVTPKMLKIDIPYIEHSGYDVGWEAAQLLLNMLKSGSSEDTKSRQVAIRAIP